MFPIKTMGNKNAQFTVDQSFGRKLSIDEKYDQKTIRRF